MNSFYSRTEPTKKEPFTLTKDGRLVINDIDELSNRGKKRRRDEDPLGSNDNLSADKKHKTHDINKDDESEDDLGESDDEAFVKVII